MAAGCSCENGEPGDACDGAVHLKMSAFAGTTAVFGNAGIAHGREKCMDMTVNDPILMFTIMVAVTLLAPLVAAKLRIPDMVLLLLAGALLGPHGLGILERNMAIMLFSAVGLLYIMFLAGLEIDLHRFITARRRSAVFGLLTFAIPQGLGTLLGRYVLFMDWPGAVLLASMFASHTLLAYPVASRLGLVRSEPVAVAIGATIITDILALLVLAVIADSVKGVDLTFGFWVSIFVSLSALIAVGWWGIPWLSRWFFRHNSENGGAQFLFVIAVLGAFSYSSHYARMEPIIGAFLAGIAFNRLIPRQSTLMNRVEFVGNTVFIPFFLISVGMLVNVGVLLRDSQSWIVAVSMVGAVIITKYAAADIARRLFGYTRDEGNVMFGLSVVQAAATLAAVLVGFELGIFGESVLNGAIAMIMVTCPLGSWAVDRYGRRMAAESAEQAAPRRVEQRLLIPVVSPSGAASLLDLAFVLRDASVPGIIHPITIVPDDDNAANALAEGEKLMAYCLAHAAAAEVMVNPGMRIGMNVGDGIVRAAREMRADLVMFGWSINTDVSSRIFGTVRKRMMQECPSRLLFCRLVLPLNTTRRLLMPLPPQSRRRNDVFDLVQESKRLAKQLGAELRIYLADPAEANALRNAIEQAQPEMPTTLIEAPNWRAARERLFEDVKADDMAILPVERRLGALWTPSLDRLPDVMAARFPQMNLLAAYPAIPDAYERPSYESVDAPELATILPMVLDNVKDLDDALRRMAFGAGAWSAEEQAGLYNLLRGSAMSYPVEMASGVVLLHAHSAAVPTTTLIIGGGGAWSFVGVDVPARFILALVSPTDQPPERHLAALAKLARLFRDKELAARIADISAARTWRNCCRGDKAVELMRGAASGRDARDSFRAARPSFFPKKRRRSCSIVFSPFQENSI